MKSYKQYFTNTTVVITGATSGAGRAIAIELAKHGAKLVLTGRREEALKEVVEVCNEMGGISIGIPSDVTDAAAMKIVAEKANEFGGSIDVWINNAGVLAAGEFDNTPIDVLDHVIKTNLLGYMHGAHAALPYFKQQKKGILINNISVGGWFPVPYAVAYSASKFGLRGFSEALRGELSKYKHIHVCDLFPAFLDSPGIQHAANYTGKLLQPAPLVYDPRRIAKAVVRLIRNPVPAVTIGSVSTILKLAHSLFPSMSRWATARVIEIYLLQAEPIEQTPGNVFRPLPYGTSIYGGWQNKFMPSKSTVGFAAALIAGFVITAGIKGRATGK